MTVENDRLRMYGCNLYLHAVTNWGLGKWGASMYGRSSTRQAMTIISTYKARSRLTSPIDTLQEQY